MTENGKVPPSLWESTLARDAVQRLVATLLDRYCRTLTFSLKLWDADLAIGFSPAGTTVSLTFKRTATPQGGNECLSPDPGPSRVQSTDTAIRT